MAAPQATFEFVAVDPTTKLKPGKSLQIRSRCMQGKNRREGTGGRQRCKKPNAKVADAAVVSQKRATAQLPPPNTLISDLALVRFATGDVGINAEDQGLLFKAFAYNFANQSLSPLDRCVDFDCLESASFEWAFHDTAFLHSVLCTSYAINDFLSPGWDGSPGRKTLLHLRETLALLQAKMGNENAHHDESVLLVVMNLGLLSAMYGDWPAAGAHYKGLQKIVQLRGNLKFLRTRPKLHFKLDRIDLAWSLSSGKKPFFLHPSVSWDPIITAPYFPLPYDLYHPPPLDWDYRLASVFQDFQYLSLRINRNALKRARHDPACFQAVLTSLQSRLAHLADIVESPIEELVRLTMLALMTTTFKTPGRKLPYKWILGRLGEVYEETSGSLQHDLPLHMWVLVTITFTITGTHPAWIRDAWRQTRAGFDWQMVKSYLMRVIWIELIHDKPGEAMFYELESLRYSDCT